MNNYRLQLAGRAAGLILLIGMPAEPAWALSFEGAELRGESAAYSFAPNPFLVGDGVDTVATGADDSFAFDLAADGRMTAVFASPFLTALTGITIAFVDDAGALPGFSGFTLISTSATPAGFGAASLAHAPDRLTIALDGLWRDGASFTAEISVVPLPPAAALLVGGLGPLIVLARRRGRPPAAGA